jgi:hypothetical protein
MLLCILKRKRKEKKRKTTRKRKKKEEKGRKVTISNEAGTNEWRGRKKGGRENDMRIQLLM